MSWGALVMYDCLCNDPGLEADSRVDFYQGIRAIGFGSHLNYQIDLMRLCCLLAKCASSADREYIKN